MGMGDLRRCLFGLEGRPQHSGRITGVEEVILRQFHDGEVSRICVGMGVAGGDHARNVARDPPGDNTEGSGFVRVRRPCGFGLSQVGQGLGCRGGRFEKHPEHRGICVGEAMVGSIFRCGQDVGGLGPIAQKAVDEVIDALRRGIVAIGETQAIAVGSHPLAPTEC